MIFFTLCVTRPVTTRVIIVVKKHMKNILCHVDFKTEKEAIIPTLAGIKKKAKFFIKKSETVSIHSSLIIFRHKQNNNKTIPNILPGIGRFNVFDNTSPIKYIKSISESSLNIFKLSPPKYIYNNNLSLFL